MNLTGIVIVFALLYVIIRVFSKGRNVKGDAKKKYPDAHLEEAFLSNLSQIKTQKKFLHEAGEEFYSKKYAQAIISCLAALKARGDNPIDRHFVYSYLIQALYKLRDSREDAIEKCIFYCQRDIELLPVFFSEYKKLYPNDKYKPECLSLERLAIIFEKQGKIKEAIAVCEKAIELGIDERYENPNMENENRKGYTERKKKLEKKLSK